MATTLDPRNLVSTDWVALGCAVRLVVRHPDDLVTARGIVADELAAIDHACSRFRADSELARIGRGTGRPVPVSPLFADAIDAALDAAVVTDGDVDPTLGAEIAAAGYDRDFARLAPHGPVVTVVRRGTPAWSAIRLDRQRGTVTIPAGVQLDLGATAKALAADRAARRVTAAIGGRGVLVSLGGDIAVAGQAPQQGWSIRVQDVTGPVGSAPTGPTQVIALHAGGLATSSTAARRWVRGGRVMHHILDPRSGVPVASPWRTVSVAAPSCLSANVASTAAI
ncbi:MAG TPA: FAD:protein FMN transferase, partial [Micromonosporaceae bacterium]